MNGTADRTFDLVLGGLILTSMFLDHWSERWTGWNPPRVTMVTIALVVVWGYMTFQKALHGAKQHRLVLEDRLERTERKLKDMDRELAERRPPIL